MDKINTIGRVKQVAKRLISEKGLEPSSVIREIEKIEIQDHSRQHFIETGYYLSKNLKKRLSKQYNYSEKEIENIIYRGSN